MFRILKTEKLPNDMIYIKGLYNKKVFEVIHYLKDQSYKISGDFTEQEKESIIKAYFNTLF